jgi:hypothetical protein
MTMDRRRATEVPEFPRVAVRDPERLRTLKSGDFFQARVHLDAAAATLDLLGERDEAVELRVASRQLFERFDPGLPARKPETAEEDLEARRAFYRDRARHGQ